MPSPRERFGARRGIALVVALNQNKAACLFSLPVAGGRIHGADLDCTVKPSRDGAGQVPLEVRVDGCCGRRFASVKFHDKCVNSSV